MTTAITTTQQKLKAMVASDGIQERLNAMLGKRASQFATSLLSLVSSSNQLSKCDPQSILTGAMTAATLDLPIQKDLGFAWIVPYGSSAQFQMGYKGFVQLAQRSGKYAQINAFCVNAGMFTGYDDCGEPTFAWAMMDDTAPAVGYGCVFRLLNGYKKAVYWTKEKAEAHGRRYSKTYGNGPWKTDFDAMALKTVLKMALSKWGVLSVEMQTAIVEDQKADDDYIDVKAKATATEDDDTTARMTGDEPVFQPPAE